MKKLVQITLIITMFVFVFHALFSAFRINKNSPFLTFPLLENLYTSMENKADIIYFGDSVILSTRTQDKDKRTIDGLLQDLLPQYSIAAIAHAGFGMDVFLRFSQHVLYGKNRPRAVIIPINLWAYSPIFKIQTTPFKMEKCLMENYSLSFIACKTLLTFESGTYQKVQNAINNNSKVFKEYKMLSSLSGEEESNKRFELVYAYRLEKTDPLIQDILNIGRKLRINNIIPIFYISPIPFAAAKEQDLQKVKQSLALIKGELNKEEFELLDLSSKVPSEDFNEKVDCHLNDMGRAIVANQLSQSILLKLK